ncbi:MAG: hypothetical protein ACRYHA_29930 [Janthinobacterium lividum]
MAVGDDVTGHRPIGSSVRPEHDGLYADALGDYFATLLHGLSVQARDGVSKQRLLASCSLAMQILDAHLLFPS